MMLQLPKKLHRLEIFEQGGQWYVADLDRERVLPISAIEASILKRAEELTVPQLIEALLERYETQKLFPALVQLERWSKLGFIFSPFLPQQPMPKDQSYRIFVMHDLLYWPPPPKHPANALQNYQLVTSLAKRLSIDFAIPEEKQEEVKFDEGGIQTVPVKSGRVFSPLWYAATGNYDAALAIAPGYFEDLPFYCQSDLPVLARLHSEGWEKEEIWNNTLAKAVLTRPYDALVVDASWVKAELSALLPDAPNVIYIPDGIDFQQFPQIEPSQAKGAIAQGLGSADVTGPIVGFVLGTDRDENLRLVSRVAANHPEWFILLYDEILPSRLPDLPENIRCFGARQYDDPFLLPVVLSGLDVLCFCASVGAPARILTGAMACGTPLVTASRAPLLELDEAFPRIQIREQPVWKEMIPWEEGLSVIAELLANPEKRIELGARAKQRSMRWTPQSGVEAWIQLIGRLKTARDLDDSQYRLRQPLLFCRWYDKGGGTVQSQAVSLDNFSRRSVEEGLAHDLQTEHTPTEIALVLRTLGRTSKPPLLSQTSSHEGFIRSDAAGAVETETQKIPPMSEATDISMPGPIFSLSEHLELQFAEKARFYPNATGYLKKSIERSLKASPFAASSHLQHDLQRSDGFWRHFDELIADIAHITGWSLEQLCNPPPSELTEEHPSFEAVKEKWYETPYYPVSEHINYIDFEPALERARFILKHLESLTEEATFLDLGFGPGVLTALILQTKPRWQGHGVDISSVCRDYAQKLLKRKGVAERAHLLVGDVRQLPYPDESFDLVVGMEVFEHIPNPREGLSEAVRALKPGGYAITALPVRLPLKMHLHVFENTQEVLALYREVGLKVLDFQEKEYQLPQRTFVDTFAFSTRSKT